MSICITNLSNLSSIIDIWVCEMHDRSVVVYVVEYDSGDFVNAL